MYGVIYLIVNLVNGKMYVGQTVQTLTERFKQHAKSDSVIGKVIRKYGRKNFRIEVIDECETREQLNEREKFWIAFFDCKTPKGYNCTDGGDGGWSYTAEALAKFSVSHRDETAYKNLIREMDKRQLTYTALSKLMGISQPALSMKLRDGLPWTESDIAKLVEIFGLTAEYLLARDDGKLPLMPASRSGENNYFFGMHHTDENRMKFSENNRADTPYKNLISEMDKRYISYRNLAVLLGISQVNISRKMRGERNFTRKDIAKLVEIFGLPAEYLLERDDEVVVTTSNRGKTPYKNLFNELQKRKMTYTVLGELLGYPSHKSISEKMQSRRKFTAKDIAKLVEIFGLPAEYLMERDDGVVVTIANRVKTLYKNLYNEMQKRKITYTALGEFLGLSRKIISQKMNGKKNFTAEDIAKLVEIFGLSAEYLMARTDN